MARLVDVEAEPLALPLDEDEAPWEPEALARTESSKLRLCCSLAARERASLSDADWLSCPRETLTDVIWLAASDKLLVSASSCAELTVDTDWLDTADAETDCTTDRLAAALPELETACDCDPAAELDCEPL